MIYGAIKVFAEWLPRGGFFIWSQQQKNNDWLPFEPMELKFRLFAWHRPSYYGTLIETYHTDNRSGIYVSPWHALGLFGEEVHAATVDWQWSEEIEKLREITPVIKEALAEGRWRPDFAKWQQGQRGWQLDWPEQLQAGAGPAYLFDWADQIIEQLVIEEAGINEAWSKLTDVYPLLQRNYPAVTFADEEEWLEVIGWRVDNTPFRTCLQLVEPAEDTPWRINILLQDKQDQHRLADWDPSPSSTTCQADRNVPAEWTAYRQRIDRDIEKWKILIPWMSDNSHLPAQRGQLCQELSETEAWEFLSADSIRLVQAGYTVFLPNWWEEVQQLKPKLKMKTRSSVGSWGERRLGVDQLLQFDWQLAVGDLQLSEEEFRRLATGKSRLMQIQGRWIQLDQHFLQKVMRLVRRKKHLSLGEALQMYLQSATPDGQPQRLEEEYDQAENFSVEVELTGQLSQMVEQLTNFSALPVEEEYPAFQGSLRNYQRVGSSWLLFLRRFGLGGCLADDMGLGKTVQLIAYLLKVKEDQLAGNQQPTPSLLICPTSVVGNWQKELARFAPGLSVYVHYGSQRKKDEDFLPFIEGKDVVITTYALSHLDKEELGSVEWDCLCLDEAQQIKNAYAKQSSAVRRLKGRHRVALTGTPMENRLTELWSIMDFLNPSYLGSLRDFKSRFVSVIERTRDELDIRRLQQLIAPFLLRRLKSDPAVELDLPEKQEQKEYIPLTVEQASLYENVLKNMFEKLEQADGMARRGAILSALTKLKQICDHPVLSLKEVDPVNLKERSNKLDRLLTMIEEVRRQGERCLIFTQFVGMGQLIQQVIEGELGDRVFFLHGGTPKAQRDKMVALFQDETLTGKEACPIFILSLKAGGLGLNLTAANHVFHFDRWWNPAVENQATDRSHRIGQHRHVQVHKFISLGTLEERINEMIERKQTLNQQIVGAGESWITELSTGQLREIFALSKEWVGA